MEIGQKLKEKRTALGMTQEEVAKMLGVTRQTIASWEKGKTYPDIEVVLKLSDLYGVSLDELLKEDAAMRKHTEDAAALPRKYWNYLYELAILLMPLGVLLYYWGAPFWLSNSLQYVGLLMLPPLWVARRKLFGMSPAELRNSLTGWAMFVSGNLIRRLLPSLLPEAEALSLGISLVCSIVSLAGVWLVWENGIHLEKSPRFWLVVFLYVGIPVYVIGSLLIEQFADQGAFSKAQPSGEYRVVQVEFGEPPEPDLILSMDLSISSGILLEFNDEDIGALQYVAPAKYQEDTIKGIWHLVPEHDPDGLYKLEVDTEDKTTLSYLIDDRLQWRWVLQELPQFWLVINNSESSAAHEMDWYAADTYTHGTDYVNSTTLKLEGTAYLQCSFHDTAELTLMEEYHHGDQTETRELRLEKDSREQFPLPEPLVKRYEAGEQYILYRLQWDGGEYLFQLNFP